MFGAIPVLVIAFGLALYFLPSLIGMHKRNAGAIFVLNLLLGWTLIGWVMALVWALTVEADPPIQPYPVQPAWACSGCQAPLRPVDRFCPACGRPIQ